MLQSKRINKFQHFPFHLVDPCTARYSSFNMIHMNNTKTIVLWSSFKYPVKDYIIISNKLIQNCINSFWLKHVDQISDDQHIIALFRIKSQDGVVLTLGTLTSFGKKDKTFYQNQIESILYVKSEEYNQIALSEFIIDYGVRSGIIDKQQMLEDFKKKVPFQNYKHYKLPITMDPLKYGILTYYDDSTNTSIVQITPLTQAHITRISPPMGTENQVVIFRKGKPILGFQDREITRKGSFIRTIGKNQYQYNDKGELELLTVKNSTKFINPVTQSLLINTNIITLDIETRVVNGNHIPYQICYYDGKRSVGFFLTSFRSPEAMIECCIKSLSRDKYRNSKIYIHNLANFDGIFLLKELAKLGELKPLIHNGKLISMKFKSSQRGVLLHFRDSYQILPASLTKLGNSFNVDVHKSIFPHDFVNRPDITLDYNGLTPDQKYFKGITEGEYLKYTKSIKGLWNLEVEAARYCSQDCISLYQIMSKFIQIIFDRFNVNVNDHGTLTGISFKIFRSHYLTKDQISNIQGMVYNQIKPGYTGGAVDMYIPQNDDAAGELVYVYDVNSLYPYVMSNCVMPIGAPRYFEGDIRKIDKDAYGFFYCKIKTPAYLDQPILQTHVKTPNGTRTMSPLGEWEDIIFSDEMDNATNLGYQFEIK